MRNRSMDSGRLRATHVLQGNNPNKSILPQDTSIQYYSSTASEESKSPGVVENDDVVKVFVRIKPQLETNHRQTEEESSVKLLADNKMSIYYPNKEAFKNFAFEKIFTDKASQEDVFHRSTAPLLKHALMGYNATVFVYGQTGTGKTHTMGILSKLSKSSHGIIPLTLKYLFNYFGEVDTHYKEQYKWELGISLVQIYLEEVFDLLNPGASSLAVREDPDTKEVYLQDLVTVPVWDLDQALELVNAGISSRTTASQGLNESSSRSHLILTFQLTQKFLDMDGVSKSISSKLTLIDLAGSERVRKTTSVGLRLEEAKSINSSLSALGNVITALGTTNKNGYVPYRASKLTRVLQNSLSNQSKISLIATISSLSSNFHETLSTLVFAQRCKDIVLKPNANAVVKENQNLEEYMRKMQQEMSQLTEVFFKKEQEYKDKIKQCETEIEDLRKSTLHLRSSILALPVEQSNALPHFEKSEYLYKLLRSLRDFTFQKIQETISMRSEIINQYENRGEISLKEFQSQLDQLDQELVRFPLKINFEGLDQEEGTLSHCSLSEAIQIIQKVAKVLIETIKNLSTNSQNAEKIKAMLAEERLTKGMQPNSDDLQKREQLETALTYMIKHNFDITKENLSLKYPNMDIADRNSLFETKQEEVQGLLRSIFQKNQDPNHYLSSSDSRRGNFIPPVSFHEVSESVKSGPQHKRAVSPEKNPIIRTMNVLSHYTNNTMMTSYKELMKFSSEDIEDHFKSKETLSTALETHSGDLRPSSDRAMLDGESEQRSSFKKEKGSDLYKLQSYNQQNDMKDIMSSSEEDVTEPLGEYTIISPRYSTVRANEMAGNRASLREFQPQIKETKPSIREAQPPLRDIQPSIRDIQPSIRDIQQYQLTKISSESLASSSASLSQNQTVEIKKEEVKHAKPPRSVTSLNNYNTENSEFHSDHNDQPSISDHDSGSRLFARKKSLTSSLFRDRQVSMEHKNDRMSLEKKQESLHSLHSIHSEIDHGLLLRKESLKSYQIQNIGSQEEPIEEVPKHEHSANTYIPENRDSVGSRSSQAQRKNSVKLILRLPPRSQRSSSFDNKSNYETFAPQENQENNEKEKEITPKSDLLQSSLVNREASLTESQYPMQALNTIQSLETPIAQTKSPNTSIVVEENGPEIKNQRDEERRSWSGGESETSVLQPSLNMYGMGAFNPFFQQNNKEDDDEEEKDKDSDDGHANFVAEILSQPFWGMKSTQRKESINPPIDLSATAIDYEQKENSPIEANKQKETSINILHEKNLSNESPENFNEVTKSDTVRSSKRKKKEKKFVTDYSKFPEEQVDMIKALENFDIAKYETEEAAQVKKKGGLHANPFEDLFVETERRSSKRPSDADRTANQTLPEEFTNYIYSNYRKREKSPIETKQFINRSIPVKDRPNLPKIVNVKEVDENNNPVIKSVPTSPAKRRARRESIIPSVLRQPKAPFF